jgi:hypothetical protein
MGAYAAASRRWMLDPCHGLGSRLQHSRHVIAPEENLLNAPQLRLRTVTVADPCWKEYPLHRWEIIKWLPCACPLHYQ